MFPRQENRLGDEKWKCAYELFERALELPSSERFTFTQSATSDPEVISLALELIEGVQDENPEGPAGLVPKPGDRIGRYEVTGKLGQGGMGSVYAARDTDLGRMAALKVLAAGLAATEVAAERLVREARAASALNHPQIVTVYEVIRVGGQVALAMELIEGTALGSYCREAQPAARVMDWGRQIAQALAAAHERRIVHRDIKPENVMVRPDGYVKVLDFGLARQVMPAGQPGSTNASGMPGGTLNYMSPEQTRGEAATSASDVFSLGVVLFEIATGTHPFATDSPIDTAHAIAHSTPQSAAALNCKIPLALVSLIGSMLAKDPRERPSAGEVERGLAGIIETDRNGTPRQARGLLWACGLAACVVCGFVLWAITAEIFAPKEPVMGQVTTQASENRVTAAALSPDGKNLAFGTLGGSVHLRRMSDGSTRPLSTPAGLQVDRIAWFADGSRLLVSGTRNDRSGGIWVMPIDGGKPDLIVPDGKDGVPSPDGTRITLTSMDGSIIWVVQLSDGIPRQVRGGAGIASFSSLIWSPDSRRIAYQREEYAPPRGRQVDQDSTPLEMNYQYSYESVDVATGRLAASAKDVVMTSACGLPDGRVLFLRWVSLPPPIYRQLWELRTDPHSGKILGPPRRLTHNKQGAMLSSISASNDGRHVSVVRVTEQPNVYVADLQRSVTIPSILNLRHLSFAEAIEYPHAWTADDRSVVFESDRNGPFQIYRQNIGQTEAEQLTLTPGDSRQPQLSADGKWVLYRWAPQPGNGKLMRVPVGGGTPEPVSISGKLDEFRCALQPRAGCILRSTENDQFVFDELDPVRGEGSELARTVWSPTVFGDWDVSPDGSLVAIPNHDPRAAKIRLVPLRGRQRDIEEKTISLSGLRNLNGVIWTADGRGWYVSVRIGPGLHHLLYADRQGRTSELNVGSIAPMYAVPAPDGRHVAFPGRTVASNAWLINGF